MRSRSVDWILWLEACDSHDLVKIDTKCGLSTEISTKEWQINSWGLTVRTRLHVILLVIPNQLRIVLSRRESGQLLDLLPFLSLLLVL